MSVLVKQALPQMTVVNLIAPEGNDQWGNGSWMELRMHVSFNLPLDITALLCCFLAGRSSLRRNYVGTSPRCCFAA